MDTLRLRSRVLIVHTRCMKKSSSTPAAEAAPSQRLTPAALLSLKRMSDPQIHPDGQRVAFTVYEADFEESRWVSHIWITEFIPADPAPAEDASDRSGRSSAPSDEADPPTPDELTRQLTFSTEGESDPLWSPDGRYLAFLSIRPDHSAPPPDDEDEDALVAQLWALPVDGGEARRITNSREAIHDFCWAPDGQTLIYLSTEPHPRPIESIHKQHSRRRVDPIVERDDVRRRRFMSVGVEERKPQVLHSADHGVEGFALSPDGEWIAYLTNYTGDDNDYHIADLYLYDVVAGTTVKVLKRAGGKYRLRWSPDGTRIAFLSWHDPAISYSRESAYVVDVSALTVRSEQTETPGEPRLGSTAPPVLDERSAIARHEAPGSVECAAASELDRDITSFEWRDNASLMALAADGTDTPLFSVPIGAQTRRLTEARCDRRDIAVDRESGRAVWVQESPTAPPEIVLREANGQEYTLTQLNARFVETYSVPPTRLVHWPSADGLRIEGLLTYPHGFREGARYPLVVQVHGGPKGRAAENLLDYQMPALWASEGYFVLRPNYRGSEGYGHEFAVANRRDLGGGDFADVMAGVEWCLNHAAADPQRIGILGGSYGGYMVNWAIGHTERFRAAISMFGIFELRTDYGNSRLSRWEHDYTGAYYWEDPDIYRKLSPATYLENIRTPTLIIHGDEDDNTSISNSREIYRALRQRGVPTQFVHYPREGHGIQEPNHRLDEIRRCLAWMDRYLGGTDSPTMFRIGDRVPARDGRMELRVVSAEVVPFVGRSMQEGSVGAEAEVCLEIVFAIHNTDPATAIESLTLSLSDVRLDDPSEAGSPLAPIGVPIDMPGGKVLVEGDNLRTTQNADRDTGELAFACGVVFQVPKSGDRSLRVLDFPAVAVHWSDDDADSDRDTD
jgi:dipeptidyl aminopeptidase/acylaminoacyl peptidase